MVGGVVSQREYREFFWVQSRYWSELYSSHAFSTDALEPSLDAIKYMTRRHRMSVHHHSHGSERLCSRCAVIMFICAIKKQCDSSFMACLSPWMRVFAVRVFEGIHSE